MRNPTAFRTLTVLFSVERKRYGAYFNRSTEENGNVFLSSTVHCMSVCVSVCLLALKIVNVIHFYGLTKVHTALF